MFHVRLSDQARKELKKMDRHVSSLILGWIRKNLEGCENPRLIGKALTEDKAGAWRYRVGDYRIICEIHDEDIIILDDRAIQRLLREVDTKQIATALKGTKDEIKEKISELIESSEDGVGTALSSTIGTELRKRYPSFDPRNYGCKKLIDLIVKLGFKTTKDSAKIVVTLPAKNKSK